MESRALLPVLAAFFCACGANPNAKDTLQGSNSGGAGGSSGSTGLAGGTGGGVSAGGSSGGTLGAGGNSTNGGSTSGGSTNGGSASGGSTNGAGGTGVFTPPTCAESNTGLPENAPALEAGVWKDISPIEFPGDPGAGDPFTQGITVDPCNMATLYLSVVSFYPDQEGPGLYRSTDAGSSWLKIGHLDEPINVVIDPADPLHMYASDGVRGSTGGFWVSTDGGDNWTQPQGFKDVSPSTDGYHVDADPADFNHVLFSYHSDWPGAKNGVLESTDGGDTWTPHEIPGAGGCGCDVYFLSNPGLGIGNSSTWLYGSQGTGHWRTTDAGANWMKVSENNMDHGGGGTYYTQEGVLYVTSSTHILRSTNNGESFVERAPQAYYLAIMGDGTNLYAANHGGGSYYFAPENDDENWTVYGDGQVFGEGAFQMAYDGANDILYAGNIRSGAWALKLH